MDRFEDNCQSFEIKNPKAAALLSYSSADHITYTKTSLGELNISSAGISYHDNGGALLEQEKLISSLNLKGVEIVYVYGLGLGYAYDAFLPWLTQQESNYLIFLEDDLGVISKFLESERARPLLRNPQVQIRYIEDSEEGKSVIQELAWGSFPKKISITALPLYQKKRASSYKDVVARVFYETAELHAVLDEYLSFGVPFFRNYWNNIAELPTSYQGSKLFGAFKGTPAILVAAGPSLAKQLDHLRDVGDKALIFAGGSSINALSEAGITPHFAAGIDPNPTQYLRARQSTSYEVPFFYRGRMLHDALKLITGPKLYLNGGDGYNISEYFEKNLKLAGKVLGGGHSVSNFLIEIADALGCSPIILVGYDLAYSGNLSYAPGVEESNEIQAHSQELHQDGPIPWKDANGKNISTEWKWVVESEWITEFKKKRQLKLFNATEGGIGMRGVKAVSFEDAVSQFCTKQQDFQGKIHALIEEGSFAGRNIAERSLKLMGLMYDSLDRAVQKISALITDLEKSSDKVHFFETTEATIGFEKLEQEDAFQYILEVFHRMRVKLDFMHERFVEHPHITKKRKQDLALQRNRAHLLFLKEVAVINQLLMSKAVELDSDEGRSIKSFSPKAKVFWS